jgi:hypothetical protein
MSKLSFLSKPNIESFLLKIFLIFANHIHTDKVYLKTFQKIIASLKLIPMTKRNKNAFAKVHIRSLSSNFFQDQIILFPIN